MKGWLKYPWLGGAVAALLLSASVPPVARAESGDVAALRQEVARLEQIVQRLDARVEQIEKRLPAASAPGSQGAAVAEAPAPKAPAPKAPAPAPAASNDSVRDQWHRIGYGMTTQAVEKLLGRPQRTMSVNTKTVWYYTYPGIGSGSVVFTSDGGVDDWQNPPFSTWW